MSGPIALLGSSEFLPGMQTLDRHLLDGRPQKVAHLPTAAGEEGHRRLRYWRELAKDHFTHRLGVEVETLDVLDPISADDPEQARRIDGAGLIYLSGGNPGYLARTLRHSEVLRRIVSAWSNGAAVAGCSAGAAALTAVAPDVRTEVDERLGLGLVPGLAVIPHYDAVRLRRRGLAARFSENLPEGVVLVGIDEHTAIVTDDQITFEVFGSGTAVLVDTGRTVGPGERFSVAG